MRKLLSFLWVTSFLISFSSCKEKVREGQYQGNFLRKISAANYSREPVTIELSCPQTTEIFVVAKNTQNETVFWIKVFDLRKHSLKILTSDFVTPVLLKKVKVASSVEELSCFQSKAVNLLSFCFNQEEFSFRSFDKNQHYNFSLSGILFLSDVQRPNLKPKSFTLQSALDQLLTTNFDSQIAVQKVLQAKNSAFSAWMNLIPHLTTNLIWNVQFSYISVIATLQGLVPFLLPTYWLQAKESALGEKVSRDALWITRANLMVSLEELFYAYERDLKISKAHRDALDALEVLKSQSHVQSIDILDDILNIVKSNSAGIERVIKQDELAISQILGFQNPSELGELMITPERFSLDEMEHLKAEEVSEWAIQRSFEIEQLNYLIRIAELKGTELYFNWLDPTGDPKMSLGLNWIGQFKINRSQLEEARLELRQLISVVTHHAYQVVWDYNLALETCRQAQVHGNTNFFSMNSTHFKFDQLNPFPNDTNELKLFVQKKLGNVVQKENCIAAYRIARARKDRILLSGYYEKLLPELTSIETALPPPI